MLTGANHGGKVKDPFDDFTGPQNVGHLFFVFKPNLFVKDYNYRIKKNVQLIKKLPKIKNIKEILYPGENKFKRFKINSNKKIKIPKNILKDIEELTSD